ncbi:MAG TPA: tRNA (adenosine(37)-N6)-threonylcarbamoyltransferase complex ATPase subunit type 1 TsaE [Cyclobacteriaceae bacterium]
MPEVWVRALTGKAVSITDLTDVAKEMMAVSEGVKVWLFEGEMGSGKTTLIKVICTILGIKDETSSPTFSIINEYRGKDETSIFHFDFYRLMKEAEAYDMGVEEYFDSGSYCFVEWPEKVESLFPLHYLKIRISKNTATTRIIEYALV